MKMLEQQLQDALDQVAEAHGVKTATVIHTSAVTAEEKLVLAQQVLDGTLTESVPAWRRPANQSKLVVEICESLEEPLTVRKRNGRGDNAAHESNPTAKSKQRLLESVMHMGLSRKEAEIFCED